MSVPGPPPDQPDRSHHTETPGAGGAPWPSPGSPPSEHPDQAAAAAPPEQPTLRSWQRPDADAPVIPVPTNTPAPPQAPAGQSPYGQRRESPPPSPSTAAYQQFLPQVSRPPLEPRAVAGLATAVVGLPGILFGLAALPRVAGGRRRSPGMAWTAVILGSVFTLAWILAGITVVLSGGYDRLTEQPQPGDVDQPRTIASANLAPGNCIATLPPRGLVGDVRLVPCEQTHLAQVIHVEVLDGDFPGEDALETQAQDRCGQALEDLGPTPVDVFTWYLTPTEEGWGQGNTQIICMARGSAGAFEGDLLG